MVDLLAKLPKKMLNYTLKMTLKYSTKALHEDKSVKTCMALATGNGGDVYLFFSHESLVQFDPNS